MEYKRKCNVCGKVFCYTDKDLKESAENAGMAALSAIGSIASTLGGGSVFHTQINNQNMHEFDKKAVDYSKCPYCNSRDLRFITDEEFLNCAETGAPVKVEINPNASTESLLKRIEFFLETKDWTKASAYVDSVLDADPENIRAYVYKVMSELKIERYDMLGTCEKPFEENIYFKKALSLSSEEEKKELLGIVEAAEAYRRQQENMEAYDYALGLLRRGRYSKDMNNAARIFEELKDYEDSAALRNECLEKAKVLQKAEEEAKKQKEAESKKRTIIIIVAVLASILLIAIVSSVSNASKAAAAEAALKQAYDEAVALMEAGEFDEAKAAFRELGDYEDSAVKIDEVDYREGMALMEAGRYYEAYESFMVSVGPDAEKYEKYCEARYLLSCVENKRPHEFDITVSLGWVYDIVSELDGFLDADKLLEKSEAFSGLKKMEGTWKANFDYEEEYLDGSFTIKDYKYYYTYKGENRESGIYYLGDGVYCLNLIDYDDEEHQTFRYNASPDYIEWTKDYGYKETFKYLRD